MGDRYKNKSPQHRKGSFFEEWSHFWFTGSSGMPSLCWRLRVIVSNQSEWHQKQTGSGSADRARRWKQRAAGQLHLRKKASMDFNMHLPLPPTAWCLFREHQGADKVTTFILHSQCPCWACRKFLGCKLHSNNNQENCVSCGKSVYCYVAKLFCCFLIDRCYKAKSKISLKNCSKVS